MKKLFNTKTIKLFGTLLILGIVFSVPAFAQTNNSSTLSDVSITISYLVSFLSWAWVIFALLAGKLMTNEFVYGSFMHLDVFLRNVWNIMKNIANFGLGFLFLYHLIRHIFMIKETPGDFIKTKIVGFLVAGILIQASWFLIGALMDITTIATSAIGAFPGQFIEEDGPTQLTLKQEYEKLRGVEFNFTNDAVFPNNYNLDLSNTGDQQTVEEQEDELNKFLDGITPNNEQAAGPLLFLGTSIFKFHNFADPGQDIDNWFGLFSATAINLFVVAMFTIAMALIFVINLVRVVVLWVFICLAPVLILLTVLDKMGTTSDAVGKLNIPDWLKFEEVIPLIIKPILYTAYLSLLLIVMTTIYRLVDPGGKEIGGMTVTETINRDAEDKIISVDSSINAGELGGISIHGLKNSLADLIIFLFALFLCWQLVKLSVSGNKIAEKITKPVMDLVEKGAESLPIIPVAGGMSWTAMRNAKDSLIADMAQTKNLGIDLRTGQMDLKGKQAFQKNINKRMGMEGAWDQSKTDGLNSIMRNSSYGVRQVSNGYYTPKDFSMMEEFFKKSGEYAKQMKGGLRLNQQEWDEQIRQIINLYARNPKTIYYQNTSIPWRSINEIDAGTSLVDYLNNNDNRGMRAIIWGLMNGKSNADIKSAYQNPGITGTPSSWVFRGGQ